MTKPWSATATFCEKRAALILEMQQAKTMSFHTTSNIFGRRVRGEHSPVTPLQLYRTSIRFFVDICLVPGVF